MSRNILRIIPSKIDPGAIYFYVGAIKFVSKFRYLKLTIEIFIKNFLLLK